MFLLSLAGCSLVYGFYGFNLGDRGGGGRLLLRGWRGCRRVFQFWFEVKEALGFDDLVYVEEDFAGYCAFDRLVRLVGESD